MPEADPPEIVTAKHQLRQLMRQRVAHRDRVVCQQASAALVERLSTHAIWTKAARVLLFAPLADEPDVWPLAPLALAQGKILALPSFVPGPGHYVARQVARLATDLRIGKFGIREVAETQPEIPWMHLDLVLVPGVAFDAQGRRLGRGRGYYDRLLAAVPGTKCGVAFDEQLVAAVPAGPQDIPLNCIMTPTRWLET